MFRPSFTTCVAVAALVVALGGTAVADSVAHIAAKFTKSDGRRIVKVIPKNSLTGTHINESKLKLRKPATATLADRAVRAATADRAISAGTADRAISAGTADTAATAGAAGDADRLDGRDSVDFAAARDLKFAVVGPAGNLVRQRGGATSVDIVDVAGHTYRVTFTGDVSQCSYTASPTGALSSETLAVEAGANSNTVRVDADNATGFHLQLIC